MSRKTVAPSIEQLAFDCPHCGAYTSQTWYDLFAQALTGDLRVPGVTNPRILKDIEEDPQIEPDAKARFTAYFTRLLRGVVVLQKTTSRTVYNTVGNLYLSECFSCSEVSVWVNGRVLFPMSLSAPEPNRDLPQSVLDDYNEAARVLPISPRGAAALLRLGIQKLCIKLGGAGKSIDQDIAVLVKNGLSPIVQQALDAVRVIGNEAVHPGTLDLKDDVDTASRLFDLVNIIGEQMISNPNHVKALYAKLPEAKRKAIEDRDRSVR